MAPIEGTKEVLDMMDLGTLFSILLVSIFLCAVGGELVKRYRPNLNKKYIHLLHLIYGIGMVYLYFAL